MLSLRGAQTEIPHSVRNRLRNPILLTKHNEITTAF